MRRGDARTRAGGGGRARKPVCSVSRAIGGTVVDASLNGHSDIWMDGGGDLYIANTGNHRVRRVYAFGVTKELANDSGDSGGQRCG